MKMSNEHTQKIFLSALMAIFLIYAYHAFLLEPLNKKENAIAAEIAGLQPKIEKANQQIRRTQAIEKQFVTAQSQMSEINDSIPAGAPIAWFPTEISAFFKQLGISAVAVKMANQNVPFAAKGFQKIEWKIDFPQTELVPLGIAIAAVENQQPLLEITGLEIDVGVGDNASLQYQHAILTVRNVVKQQ